MSGTVEISFIFGIVIGYILLGTTFCIYIIISILFADDTSVIISSTNCDGFCTLPHLVLSHMVLNLHKTNIMKFRTNTALHCVLVMKEI